jgi:putative flippase GtrA
MNKLIARISHNQFCRYLITGASVALINILIYTGLQNFNIVYATANLFALIISKIFGYFMNKLIVYRSYTNNWMDTLIEILKFVLARGITGVVDFCGVIFLVEYIKMDKLYAKILLIVVVVILNYVLGKKAVFKSK